MSSRTTGRSQTPALEAKVALAATKGGPTRAHVQIDQRARRVISRPCHEASPHEEVRRG
jgi:hypothetical protein